MDYQSNNLVVPRGSILFNPFVPGTLAGRGYKQLGNCPEFTLTRGANALEHRSSQQGISTKDKRYIISDDLNGSLMTDDIRSENLRYWFMSAPVQTVTISSASAQSETIDNVQKGAIYQLGRSTLAPLGLRGVTVTAVEIGATTYVNNTDYTFDVASGLLTVLSGGSITEGGDLEVTYNVAASTLERVAASNAEVEGEMLFISNNPFSDMAQSRLWIPRCTLTPNGDFNLMTPADSPDWQTIGLSITALKLGSYALAYRDNIPVA